jgi:hypothetical protein
LNIAFAEAHQSKGNGGFDEDNVLVAISLPVV